ncbi:MAG: hypothetical protein KDE47_21135 [Caldilineaceae bacterium]|nr:hypothetical protein [Caldilineaceae bacterium]
MLPERTTDQVDYLDRSSEHGRESPPPYNSTYTPSYNPSYDPTLARENAPQREHLAYREPASYRDPAAYQGRSRQYAEYNRYRSSQAADAGKNFVLGLLGGVAGVIAMDLFSQQIMPLLTQDGDEEQSNGQGQQGNGRNQEQPLDSIAVIGEHHRANESATAALGRHLYHWATDEDHDKQTKTTLSYLVHWGYGIAQGGVYASMREPTDNADLLGGAAFGAGLWLLGDELMVPMLGLQDGPTASGAGTHVNRLAMHLVYGITTAATVQWLRRTI